MKSPNPSPAHTPFVPAQYVDFLTQMAEQNHQAVFVFDPEHQTFRYLNAAFESLCQLTRQEVSAQPDLLLGSIHPDDLPYLAQAYEKLPGEKGMKNIEFRIRSGSRERFVCLSAFILQSPDGGLVLAGFAEDNTVGKKYREKLEKFAAKKNSVLEILSHQLAGPLHTIGGLSSVLARKIKQGEEGDIIKLIGDTSQKGIRLIREFVQQEFLESSSVELLKVRVDMVEKLRQVVEQYQHSEEAIAKTFHLEATADKIYASVDEYKFVQVINNLLSNAIKFTPDNGVITTRLEEQPDSLLIAIADNGIGIPEPLQKELFEKFTKARRPGLKGEPSVGLGMSIARTIVEWHGGSIWLESREQKGTTFYIQIPKE